MPIISLAAKRHAVEVASAQTLNDSFPQSSTAALGRVETLAVSGTESREVRMSRSGKGTAAHGSHS